MIRLSAGLATVGVAKHVTLYTLQQFTILWFVSAAGGGAVQVPDVLFTVCCSVVQHGQSQGVTAATITAFTALCEFFRIAKKGGFLFETDNSSGMNCNVTPNSVNSSSSSSSSALSLAPEIRSQVLQSGLMEAFATAMAAAAADLLVRHPPQYQPATQTRASSSTAAAGAGQSERVSFIIQGQHFSQLLQSWYWVCRLWPAGREQLAAVAIAAPAAVRLSAAIMQVVSRDLPAAVVAAKAEAPQARSEDHTGPSGAVYSAKSYAGDLCYAVYGVQQTLTWLAYCVFVVLGSRDVGMPELGPVLAMPEFTTGLATMVVLLTQALSAQQWLGPTAAATATHNTSSRSSSNGSGGGSVHGIEGSSRNSPTSSSIPSTVSTTSRVMNNLLSAKSTRRKLEAMLRNLPECTNALLETLGLDSRAVVWASAAQHEQASSWTLATIATALVVVFGHQPVADQRLQQLLLLVPATLLHWAGNTRISGLQQARGCAGIVAVPCTHLINRLCSSFPKQSAQQHDADKQEGSALQGYEPVTPAGLKQVLPDIQKVLAMLLQHPWEPQPPSGSLQSTNGGV